MILLLKIIVELWTLRQGEEFGSWEAEEKERERWKERKRGSHRDDRNPWTVQCHQARDIYIFSYSRVSQCHHCWHGGGGGGLGHSLLWGLHPWLYPGAATSASPPVVTTRDVSRHYPMSLGVQKSPQWRTTWLKTAKLRKCLGWVNSLWRGLKGLSFWSGWNAGQARAAVWGSEGSEAEGTVRIGGCGESGFEVSWAVVSGGQTPDACSTDLVPHPWLGPDVSCRWQRFLPVSSMRQSVALTFQL